MAKEKLPITKALMVIILSTVIVSGTASFSWLFYTYIQNKKSVDDKYIITTVVQTGPVKNALPTSYLLELLNLSADDKVNLHDFDVDEVESKLLESPMIAEVEIEKKYPDTLYIDYTVRNPMALLGDYFNAAIDHTGSIFPVRPYLTPKNLPEIYLGVSGHIEGWQSLNSSPAFQLSRDIFDMLFKHYLYGKFDIKRIDVSQAYLDSAGQRQVVIILKDNGYFRILRLNTCSYAEEFQKYLVLRDKIPDVYNTSDVIIDFRAPKLAFIKPIDDDKLTNFM